jgi:hypothetical protein
MNKFKPLKEFFTKKEWPWYESIYLFQSINVSQKEDLFLYNYSKGCLIQDDHPTIMKCRGLVLNKEGRLMNFPFERFFDYRNKRRSFINWHSARVEEMIEGILLLVFWDGGHWQVITRDSLSVRLVTDEIFINIFKKEFKNFDRLDKNHCYMFQVVSRENRIITRHEEDRVYLIGSRDLKYLKELSDRELNSIAIFLRVLRPRVFEAKSYEDCKKIISKQRGDFKGLVVIDSKNRRVKVKNEQYYKLDHLNCSGKDDCYSNQILFEHVLGVNKLDECCIYEFPRIYTKLKKISQKWGEISGFIMDEFNKIKKLKSREEFLKKVQDFPIKDQLIAFYDGKEFDPKLLEWEEVSKWRDEKMSKINEGRFKFRAIDCDGKLRYSDEFDSLSKFFLEYESKDWKDLMQSVDEKDVQGNLIFEKDVTEAEMGYKGVVKYEAFICAKFERAISKDIKVVGNDCGAKDE